jgi:hypothetical protein
METAQNKKFYSEVSSSSHLTFRVVFIHLYYNSAQSLQWYLMVLQNGTFEWHFVTHSRSLCVTHPKTYLLWFWLPPSFPICSITLPFSLSFLCSQNGHHLWEDVEKVGNSLKEDLAKPGYKSKHENTKRLGCLDWLKVTGTHGDFTVAFDHGHPLVTI